jgi:hypothetical protein
MTSKIDKRKFNPIPMNPIDKNIQAFPPIEPECGVQWPFPKYQFS